MDSTTWNWAFTLVLDVVVSLFGSAVTVLGVATISLLVLLWLHTIIRLIVAPIIGRSFGTMLDTAMYDTKRQSRAARNQNAVVPKALREKAYKWKT